MILMSDTVTYRPTIDKGTLQKLAKRFHYNLNRFIDDAVKEKIIRERKTKGIDKLSDAISKAVYEHMNWKVYTPSKKLDKELNKEIKDIKGGKAKYKTFTGKINDL